jgi:diguanylate cyclase (GGDEF)-like protein
MQSVRDPLTGLFNRRYLEETLDREQYRAQRSQTPLSLLMIDVDHFKHFNDTHGHQSGDHLLKMLGGQLRRGVRGEDVACRYGGEEFVVVLPGAAHGDAVKRAESLCHDIAHLEGKVGGHTLGPVTASIGVATFPRDGENWVAVLEVADRRLYRAKEAGRDCVVGADPPEPRPSDR